MSEFTQELVTTSSTVQLVAVNKNTKQPEGMGSGLLLKNNDKFTLCSPTSLIPPPTNGIVPPIFRESSLDLNRRTGCLLMERHYLCMLTMPSHKIMVAFFFS